jgi:hypothetical protein
MTDHRTIRLVRPEDPALPVAGDGVTVLRMGDDPGDVPAMVRRLREGADNCVVIAPPTILEAVLKEMLGAPPSPARVDFVPGALTELAVIDGEVALRQLNQGAALDGIEPEPAG